MKEESKLGGCIVPPVTLQTRGDELSDCAYPVSQLHGHGLCTGVSLLLALACVLGGGVEGGAPHKIEELLPALACVPGGLRAGLGGYFQLGCQQAGSIWPSWQVAHG